MAAEIPEQCPFCKAERAGIQEGRIFFKCGTTELVAGFALGRAMTQSEECLVEEKRWRPREKP